MSEKQPATPKIGAIKEYLPKLEDEVLRKYKLEFLGEGGEQIVFGVDKHPDIVAKASKAFLNILVQRQLEQNTPQGEVDAEMQVVAKRYLEKQTAAYRVFKKHFGKAALKERLLFMPVPFPVDLLDDDVRGAYQQAYPNQQQGKAYTVVRLQERLKIDSPREDIVITPGGYPELDELVSERDYTEFNPIITGATVSDVTIDEIIRGRKILAADADLRAVAAEFAQKAMIYTRETGRTLDLIGEGNVVFYKDGDSWAYKLPDAMYPGVDDPLFLRSQKLVQSLVAGEDLDETERNILMNALSYVRQINALAQVCGVSERLQLIPRLSKADHARIYKVLKH